MSQKEGNRQEDINFGQGVRQPRDEFDTLVQPFLHAEMAVDANAELEAAQDDGWEILHIAVNSLLEGEYEEVWHYRIVTLKREAPSVSDDEALDTGRESHLSSQTPPPAPPQSIREGSVDKGAYQNSEQNDD